MELEIQQNFSHKPVLTEELLSLFSKKNPPQKILDCSFGRGGHSLAFLKEFPFMGVMALDCDEQAIQSGLSLKETKEGKITLLKKNFHNFPSSAQKEEYDIIIMDLGPSSPQIDDKNRGFSFYQDGPLDMRMDRSQKFKASDIVNFYSKKELVRLFQSYGEIKSPYKITEKLLRRRREKKFERTLELSQWIQKHWPRRFSKKHPATPWFLALRIEVNRELEGLQNSLPQFVPLLKPGGYLAVISFHSLEDRIVKKAFRQFVTAGQGRLFNKKVIRPQLEEKQKNYRSRSARLRVFQK